MWICPDCGVRLLTRNLWHSCGQSSLAEWEARMGPRARALFDRFSSIIAECGPYSLGPAKTRIAFLAQVRFAGITALSERGMTCTFALPYPLQSPRFARVWEIVPGWWAHRIRVTAPEQLDTEVKEWLQLSYRLMGMRERLTPPPEPPS